jgi:hypothetical protein
VSEPEGLHDFDFLYGRWAVRAQRRKEWLSGCEEWFEFAAELRTWPLLDGYGNVDDYRADFGDGLVGTGFRLFDPATRLWSIYSVGKAYPVMDAAPVVGRFEGATGVFEAEEQIDDRLIFVRFIWSRVNEPEPHWEQAFSADRGRTWETNWVMDYTRISEDAHSELNR